MNRLFAALRSAARDPEPCCAACDPSCNARALRATTRDRAMRYGAGLR